MLVLDYGGLVRTVIGQVTLLWEVEEMHYDKDLFHSKRQKCLLDLTARVNNIPTIVILLCT